MKAKLFLLLLLIFGCKANDTKYNWYVQIRHTKTDYTTIFCDSVQMVSQHEAYIWIDGQKSHIFGKQLRPGNKKY